MLCNTIRMFCHYLCMWNVCDAITFGHLISRVAAYRCAVWNVFGE